MEDTTSTTCAAAEGGIAPELDYLRRDILGRVRTSAAKRAAILSAFDRSGLSLPLFAHQVGLKAATLATWVHRRRHGCEASEAGGAGNVPFTLFEAVIEAAPPSRAVSLEVEAPGGIKLRVVRREDIALAVELLQALRGVSPC